MTVVIAVKRDKEPTEYELLMFDHTPFKPQK